MTKSIAGKSILVATLVLSFQLAAFCQGTWSSLAPISAAPGGTGKVEGAAVSGAGEIIVVAGGLEIGLGDTNITRRYDIATDSWSFGTPMPTARAELAYGDTGHGGMIYAIGGRTAPGGNKELEGYDLNTDTWTKLADMPTGRAAAAAAVVGNAIYVMGGRTSSAPCSGGELAVVERYDIDSNTWSTVSPLLSPRSDFVAVAAGGKIFVFGGCFGFDPASQSLAEVDVYDPVKDTWSKVSDMPAGPRSVLMAGIKGNRIFVMGGRDTTGAATHRVEVFNFVKNSWSTAADMITARGETGVYSHGGQIFVPGGSQPAFGISTNVNEVLTP